MPTPRLTWPESRRAAVSLTYDDGLPSHHRSVAPGLTDHGITATFYVPIAHDGSDLLDEPEAWAKVAAAGHELGNHSVHHPCRRDPNRGNWLADAFELRSYTEDRLRRELKLANFVLRSIDGRDQRTYGNTCHHTTFGPDEAPISMDPLLSELFLAARGPCTRRPAELGPQLNWSQLGCFGGDGQTLEQLQASVQQAVDVGGWAIFTFHGVGHKAHRLHIDEATHQAFVNWLADDAQRLWVRSAAEVAAYARQALDAV